MIAPITASIDRFVAQAGCLHVWLAGIGPAHLDREAVPGTWTLRQLVLHMLDSDLAAGHRMKRVAGEHLPLIIAYDESAIAATCYRGVDPALAAELFRLHRLHTGEVLRSLPAAAFDRAGVHNQRGKITLADLVRMYVDHVTHHETFAMAKRKALGLSAAMA